MGLQLPKWLIKMSGELYIHKYLFWVLYKPHHYALTGEDTRKVLKAVKPGDILLRRYDGYVNTLFTPGFWGHAALCETPDTVIHALGVGVVREDIITFCRTDSVAVLRVAGAGPETIEKAIACARAHEEARTAYDYRFRDNGKHAVYCTELVNVCYGGLFNKDFETAAGNCVLTPDGIRRSAKVETVLEKKYDPKGVSTRKRRVEPCAGKPETCEETLARRLKDMDKLPAYLKRPAKRRTAR